MLSLITQKQVSLETVSPGCLPHSEPLDLGLRTICLPPGTSEAPGENPPPRTQGPALSPSPPGQLGMSPVLQP